MSALLPLLIPVGYVGAGGLVLAGQVLADRARRAARHGYRQVTKELRAERQLRVRLERVAYEQRAALARHGVGIPAMDLPDPPPVE